MLSFILLCIFLGALPTCLCASDPLLEERGAKDGLARTYTRMGPSRVYAVPTYYTTKRTPCTKTKTVRKVVTKYVKPKRTFTTTVTTTTTEFTLATTTVPTSAGFIPIEQSIMGLMKKREEVKHQAQSLNALEERKAKQPLKYKPNDAYKYPQRVDVYRYKSRSKCAIVTKTVKHTKKACKTKVPKTVTTTTTETVVEVSGTSTQYDACKATNMATTFNGKRLEGSSIVESNPSDGMFVYNSVVIKVLDAAACCSAAFAMSPPSAFWSWTSAPRFFEENCFIYTKSDCAAQNQVNRESLTNLMTVNPDGVSGNATFGNAYCGQWERVCTVAPGGSIDPNLCTDPFFL